MSTSTEAPEAVEPIRNVGESIRSIVSDLRESASVESVYGGPVETREKTVIPVARVAYGFGGGAGTHGVAGGGGESGSGRGDGGGSGLGGGVAAIPVGVVEVSDEETRFVRFGDRKRMGLVLILGLLFGFLVGRRRARK